MAEARLRVIGVPPSGSGLRSALAKHAARADVLTAFSDSKLRTARSLLPDGAEIDAVPLGDLVGRFLMMLGEPVGRIVTRGQQEAMVEVAVSELAEETPLSRSGRYPGTARLITERLAELRDYGSDGPDLALSEVEDSDLRQKLAALAAIANTMDTMMREANQEFATTRAERCLALASKEKLPVKKIVALVGREEKPVYEQWFRWVADQKVQVRLLVDVSSPGLFENGQRLAGRLGVELEPWEDAHWTDCLFTDRTATTSPSLEVLAAADSLAECEWALRGCSERIAAGVLPHRVGIFARDAESYAPLLLASAERLGVPLSLSLSVPLLSNGFARFVRQCLEALASDDVRRMARLARSSYVACPSEIEDRIWATVRAGYSEGDGQWDAVERAAASFDPPVKWFSDLLEWRRTGLGEPARLSIWLNRLRLLVGGAGFSDLVAALGDETRNRDLRAQTVMQRRIADTASIYDRTDRPALSLPGFVRLARSLWEDETYVLTGTPNGVAFSHDTDALGEYDSFFVLGMLEGSLPRRRSEDPLLFDSDRAALGRALPTSFDSARAERDEFVRLCRAASSSLTLCYPQTDDDRDNVPAFYLDEATRAAGPRAHSTQRSRAWIAPPLEDCRIPADRALRLALQAPKMPERPTGVSSEVARRRVMPDFSDGVTPDEVSHNLACPFQSGLRNRIGLRPPSRRRLMEMLRDLPLLSGLVTQPDKEHARRALNLALEQRLAEKYADLEGWEARMLRASGRRLIEGWIDREFGDREAWPRDPGSLVSNPAIGEHGLVAQRKMGAQVIRFKGTAAALTRQGDTAFLHLFRQYVNSDAQYPVDPSVDPVAVRDGLYLTAMQGTGASRFVLDIDGMNGHRRLIEIRSASDQGLMPRQAGKTTIAKAVDGDWKAHAIATSAQAKVAIERMAGGDIVPTPGVPCERCQYGELCRVSTQFRSGADAPAEEGAGE